MIVHGGSIQSYYCGVVYRIPGHSIYIIDRIQLLKADSDTKLGVLKLGKPF